MTERWISQERHYCKYCNTWTSGDKMSVKHHENGNRHKMNVRNYLTRVKKDKDREKKGEKEFNNDMAQIQRAAEASYHKDLANTRHQYIQSITPNVQQPTESNDEVNRTDAPQPKVYQQSRQVEKQATMAQMQAFFSTKRSICQ